MHQHPRAPPSAASPANSPRQNYKRTTNTREQDVGGSRASSDRGTPSEQGIGIGEGAEALMRGQESVGQSKDSMAKLNQVLQNYFTKAALIILHARIALPAAYSKDARTRRVNKWFNVDIDETDLLRDDLRVWRNCEALTSRPPIMIIETFIDAQDLTNNQSLVVIDEQGRRWDVEEALNKSPSSSTGGQFRLARPEVVVERWVVRLGEPSGELPQDLAAVLPRTYKNSVVLFRSLYTCSRLFPAWRFGKRLFKDRPSPKSPKLKYRIMECSQSDLNFKKDCLSVPLFESRNPVVEHHSFDPIESPAGPLSVDVTYRSHCDLHIDDSEAFLSSRLMGMDEDYFEPSIGRKQNTKTQERKHRTRDIAEVGSLPFDRLDTGIRSDQGQAYGSLSTFHHPGPPTGSSPLSALRAARAAGSESPEDMMPRKAPPISRSGQGSRSSLRSAEGAPNVGRRPSVSFMPFKSPSLSASPSQAEQSLPSVPRGSLGKTTSPLAALAEARAPSTLGPYGSVASRGSSNTPEQGTTPSIASSPKAAAPTRYSSSFGHRKAKLSTGNSSRTEDDNSSGKASITSSAAQPGSGVLAEGGGASSGSVQTDDDNISDFLKMLDQKKDLKSFRKSADYAATEASTRRTSAALSKFQRMRDSNAALSDSMSSSLLPHRSSSSSSRQLSSVPPMVAGTSMSASSSPGKPISPHTPHTPAIPSRLSANSIIEYPNFIPDHANDRTGRLTVTESPQDPSIARDSSTGAIDIPTSPRPYHPNYRRSSSVAQQPRAMPFDDDDMFPFGMRSASAGVDDRPPLSLSVLAALHDDSIRDESAVAVPSVEQREITYGPMFDDCQRTNAPAVRQNPSSLEGRDEGASPYTRGSPYRPRVGKGSGRGSTPPQGSSSSLADRGSASGGSSDHRGGRYSFSRPPSTFEEEEPLLFAMSDFSTAQPSRRSLEANRGGSKDGGGDSSLSSRRGSRRGG